MDEQLLELAYSSFVEKYLLIVIHVTNPNSRNFRG
jgi:hypothetical protein